MKRQSTPGETIDSIAAERVGVIFPTGMLGGGFSLEMVRAGIEMGATAIAVDAG